MPLEVRVGSQRWEMHDPGGRIGRKIGGGKPYEYGLLREIQSLGLQGSALDIGAHVGNHTLFLAIACGLTVHAFEANADRAETIRANIALNTERYRSLAGRVHVYPFACGDEPGEMGWEDGRQMTLGPSAQGVPLRRVDDVVSLDDLVLVKLDVEGMEPQALEGMREHLDRCSPIIYSETHTEDAHDAQAAVLEPLGYRMTGRVEMGSKMERWER